MYYTLAHIQYDGSAYFGFQWQSDLLTIQSELNRALGEIHPGKITTMGASRIQSRLM